MRTFLALLLALELAGYALIAGGQTAPPRAAEPTSAPEVTAPAASDGLAAVLERIGAEYDPVAAGTVGALRWAGTLMDGYAADGRDPAAAESAAADYLRERPDAAALESRLLRLRLAALQLASGEDLGLIRDPGRRASVSWTAESVEELFTALFRGAGLTPPMQG